MLLIIKLALINSQAQNDNTAKAMTQVKNYILTNLLPTAINRSLSFISASLSLVYMELFEKAMEIEIHLRDNLDLKGRHMQNIQKLYQNLILIDGVKLGPQYVEKYEVIFTNFMKTFKTIKNEKNKKDGLRILRLFLEAFNKQVIAPLPDFRNKEMLLLDTVFLSAITDEVLIHLSDYFDTVREEAQMLLVSISSRYLPPQIALAQE